MAYSAGTRTMMGEVAGWFAFACFLAVVGVNFAELRRGVGHMMGIPIEPYATSDANNGRAEAGEPPRSGYSVELTARDNGHYHTEAEINGRPVEVMVDTGATMVVLTFEAAEQAGLYLKDSDFTHKASTANGVSRIAPVTLERVSIGDITVRDVPAAVAERGRLQTTLLGMTFLSRLDRVDMRSGKLLLQD
ncbi:MAG: TIGR02281 family clan AA aspartic protease [Hyphomicrobium sp.]